MIRASKASMLRLLLTTGAALALAGCQTTGSAPPSGYQSQSDAAGLISSTTEIDPATGMQVTTSTAWEQGSAQPAKRDPASLAGAWTLTDGKIAKCGFALTATPSPFSANFMTAKRVSACPNEYTDVVSWVALDNEMMLLSSLGRILAVLTEQNDGSWTGSFTTDAGPVPVVFRRGGA